MPLAARDRTLALVSIAICLGDWEQLRALRRDATPDRAWREAVLQAHLFAGFPRVVEACGVLAEAGGLGRPDPDEATGPDDPVAGRALFERIYAEQTEAVRAALESYHPALASWIEGHAYGRVLARPGLEASTRELLAVACLTALGQDRQLASHARGAIRCGAERAQLDELLDAIAPTLDPARLARARRVVGQFG